MSDQIPIDKKLIKYLQTRGYRSDNIIDKLVKETLALSGALEQNPVSFGEAEIRKVLDALEA